MHPTPKRLACLALLWTAMATPCLAESLASSAASAGSVSLGSASDSLSGSSNSSAQNKPVAQGDYRVVDVAAIADRPGMLRLQMQATMKPGADGRLWLTLPRQALAQRPLLAGDLVHARHRPYGVEFARTDAANARVAFFLVLADDWHRELDPRAVTL